MSIDAPPSPPVTISMDPPEESNNSRYSSHLGRRSKGYNVSYPPGSLYIIGGVRVNEFKCGVDRVWVALLF
jgi:hypothetical protein